MSQQQSPNAGPGKRPGQRQIQLEMTATTNSVYANAVVVRHTPAEVIMDFVHTVPGDPRARIQSRVVMTPASAKMFLKALGDNIERFESAHGEISTPNNPTSLAEHLFRGVKPDDGGDSDDE